MLSNGGLRSILGGALLLLAALGIGCAIGRPVIHSGHRHVSIEVFNVNSIVQVFVNCHQAGHVDRRQAEATLDLGWLKPADRVFLSATSRDRRPSYGFRGLSNERTFVDEQRGNVETLGFAAEPDAVVFAEAYLADGTYLGHVGCQSPAVADVPGYTQSPADGDVPEVRGDKPSYDSLRSPFDQIYAAGDWSLLALGALGIVTALAIGPVRRLIWRHRDAAGAIGVLAALIALFFGDLGPAALRTAVEIGGTSLLVAVAIALLAPGLWRRLVL